MVMINDMTDNFIPSDQRPRFLADGSHWLARAIFFLDMAGGIPPEEKQKAGEEAIVLSRKALELFTQLYGIESAHVADDVSLLADVLGYFNDVDDDEVLRLYEQAIAIYRRVEGSSSPSLVIKEDNLGITHETRAKRAQAANDLDRCMTNLEQALPHYREAARIFRAANIVDGAAMALRKVAQVEKDMRQIGIARAAAAAVATRG